jgi:ABC-type lipoprotein export system ATPase subunit
MTAVVEARQLFRLYATGGAEVAALRGLDLEVRRGEILTILGPSGSGKSTLLRAIAGHERLSAGSLTVLGQDVRGLGRRELARLRASRLAYADQRYRLALSPDLTIRESIGVPLRLRGWTGADVRARTAELLRRVALDARAGARPAELSGGELQRVAVCVAVAHRPELLLADEPTAELDSASAAAVLEVVRALVRADGTTAVLVSHDPEAAEVATRVVTLRDGRITNETVDGTTSSTVDADGWVQLPAEARRHAAIGHRAALREVVGAIEVVGDASRVSHSEPDPASGLAPLLARAPTARPPGRPVVVLQGVSRSFAGRSVLTGVDLTAGAGTLTVVTGPSGSGKTTLLRLVAALDRPDGGSVTIAGEDVGGLSFEGQARLRRTVVAVAGQDAGLIPFLDAAENVRLGLLLGGTDDPEAATDDALSAVALAHLRSRRVESLSTGERARVALARAIARRPAVLVVDEPTARLDRQAAAAVARLLVDLARAADVAIVCATHDPLVVAVADIEVALAATGS